MNEWVTQLRKGLLEFSILSLLTGGEAYGYTIVQRLREIEPLATTESTVYPILARLLKDGFLKVRVVPSNEGPARRYFSLTVLGKHRVREMGDYWDELHASLGKLRRNEKGEGNE